MKKGPVLRLKRRAFLLVVRRSRVSEKSPVSPDSELIRRAMLPPSA